MGGREGKGNKSRTFAPGGGRRRGAALSTGETVERQESMGEARGGREELERPMGGRGEVAAPPFRYATRSAADHMEGSRRSRRTDGRRDSLVIIFKAVCSSCRSSVSFCAADTKQNLSCDISSAVVAA